MTLPHYKEFKYKEIDPTDGQPIKYGGPVPPPPPVDQIRFATYGDPQDQNAPPPPFGTKYTTYGRWPLGTQDPGFSVYGEPRQIDKPRFDVDPEDARAIILEAFPDRINYACNPRFEHPVDDRTSSHSWVATGRGVAQVAVTGVPFGIKSGLRMQKDTLIRYGNFGDTTSAIWASMRTAHGSDGTSEKTSQNLWKISIITSDPQGLAAGFYVKDRLGNVRRVIAESVVSQPMPWDLPEVDHTFQVQVKNSAQPREATVSKSGWYVFYAVMDLGAEALWAVPFFQTSTTSTGIVVTGACVERWDDLEYLTGVGAHPLDMATANEEDFIQVDHLVFFDGDSTNRGSDDYVWMGDPKSSVSGYYPQLQVREHGMRELLREWVPIGRRVSLRFVYERP